MLRSIAVALLLAVAVHTPAAGADQPSAVDAQRGREQALERLRDGVRRLHPAGAKRSQLRALELRRAPDSISVLVVGCDFSDSLMFGRDLAQFPGWPEQTRRSQLVAGTGIEMFAAHDSTYFDLQMQRLSDYFRTVSFDRLALNWDVHGAIVNLPGSMGYYGDTDSSETRAVRMAAQVVAAIDDDVDFSPYDTLLLVHAGAGKETDILGNSPEQIFSNYLDRDDFVEAGEAGVLPGGQLSTAEGPIEHVLVLPESESQDAVPEAGLSGFFDLKGVWCFEVGLRLGMLSLADYTPSRGPDSQGIGNFGLMGYGLFTGLGIVPSAPSAINRMLMGWVEPVTVESDAFVRIGAMGEAGAAVSDTLLVKVPVSDREYWLLEYRLQDPDGDLFYGFDDLNGNRVPDFYDADSTVGGGIPTSTYDPAEDEWEREYGAEVDWFMSENPARTADRCMRAGGSGVYVYHVDERVIQNALLGGRATVNDDRDHKGVDVEEADGIQDLDSPRPSAYLLGWDNDVFRGEGNDEFGPDTNPSTTSADGWPTGIRIHSFSDAIVDTLDRTTEGICTGFVYAPAMTFEVEFGGQRAGAPVETARHVFDAAPARFDPRLVDLGTSPADPTPDGAAEILFAGDEGRVYAFRGDLTEWIDGDGDPSTVGVLAVGTEADGPAAWTGPPALVDFDDDGRYELVLSTSRAVHAFSSRDGSEWDDGDADAGTFGPLYRPLDGETLVGPAAALARADGRAELFVVQQGVERVAGTVVEFTASGVGHTATSTQVPGRALGPGALTADGPARRWVVPLRDEAGDAFLVVTGGVGTDTSHLGRVDVRIAATPISAVSFPGGATAAAFVGEDGSAHLALLPEPGDAFESRLLVRNGRAFEGASSPIAGGPLGGPAQPGASFARAVGGRLSLLDEAMSERDGFPYHPEREGASVQTDSILASPILVDLDGRGDAELIWADASGVVHAVDLEGRPIDGYPFLGPAEPAGSPAAGDVDGDGDLELLLLGRFESLVETDAPAGRFERRSVGQVRVLALEAPGDGNSPWLQGRGGISNGAAILEPPRVFYEDAGILREETVLLQPQPAVGDVVRVRVQLDLGARVVATIHNLEGEEVARSADVLVPNGATFDEAVSIAGLAPGMYVCRIAAGGEAVTAALAVVR